MATNEKFILEFATKGLEGINTATSKIESLNSKINALTVGILGVGFGTFIAGAIEAADKISDLSDATGISITNLKAFETALEVGGGKAKNVERAILGFAQSIETANDGSLKARDAFAKVGVSLKDLQDLSEQNLLDKTIQGLARMKEEGTSASEIASTASVLLTKAFRGVDVASFFEEYKKGKLTLVGVADEIKRAADANAKLEAAFRTMQLGALQAMQPILDMMGETKLTTEAAAKIVTFMGVALGLTFGASMLARVIALNTAILGTAAAAALVGKNPLVKLIAGAGIAAIEAAGGLAAYNAALGAVEESQKKAAKAAEEAQAAGSTTPDAPTGNAARKQELDARQKAAIESNKRIALSEIEISRETAIRTSSDLQRIDNEAEIARQRAQAEIFAKENLSKLQKDKEYNAARLAIDAKADSEYAAKRAELDAQVAQQKAGYLQANNTLLGVENTETQRINELIAQQPLKYKEIGDEMRKNAVEQDAEKKRIEEIIRLRQLDRDRFALINNTAASISAITDEQLKKQELLGASSQKQREIIEHKYDADKRINDLLRSTPGYYEASLVAQGKSAELTAKQIALATDYTDKQADIIAGVRAEQTARDMMSTYDEEMRGNFVAGWKEAYEKYAENSRNSAEQAGSYFNTFTSGMEDAFVKFVQTGKLSFKDLANSMIADFARIMAKKAIVGMFGAGGIFGGFFAEGGNPPVGVPSIVGEKGPELFIPSTAGTIIPNRALSNGTALNMGQASSTYVTYNINANDAASFKQMLAQDPTFLHAVAEKGRRSLPSGATR